MVELTLLSYLIIVIGCLGIGFFWGFAVAHKFYGERNG